MIYFLTIFYNIKKIYTYTVYCIAIHVYKYKLSYLNDSIDFF